MTRSCAPTLPVSPSPLLPYSSSSIVTSAQSFSKPAINLKYLRSDDDEQREVIRNLFHSKYLVTARELQVEAVMSLIRKNNTFLIASTGYGKSRIPELFSMMFVKSSKPIVLILNPLDALGDNQVCRCL